MFLEGVTAKFRGGRLLFLVLLYYCYARGRGFSDPEHRAAFRGPMQALGYQGGDRGKSRKGGCPHEALLSLQEVARRLDVPETTIYGWRYQRKGPKGHKVGNHVRYFWSDVLEWPEQRADRNLRH